MFKSPRKNGRNKGVKIKHIIQISLLLGVSIWLIYQIHHSDGKKPSVTTKILQKSNNDSSKDVLKLGRKVLRPKVKETKAGDEQNNANEGSEDVEDHESDDHEEVGENEHADGKEDGEEIKGHENKKENDDKGHEQVVVMENTVKKMSPYPKDVKMSIPSKNDDDNGDHNERDSKKQSAQHIDSAPGSYPYETKPANYMKSTGTEKNMKDGSEQKDDGSILEEEKDALTDLETLPESGTGGSSILENATTE